MPLFDMVNLFNLVDRVVLRRFQICLESSFLLGYVLQIRDLI